MPDELTARFATAMAALGPFEANPALAAAVSGGADSMALAVLAADWTRQRGGTLLALVVDHGLRPTSAQEAHLTIQRLNHLRIPARLLSITGLSHGPAMAERARISRYSILADACAQSSILHLLLGHHAADQVETLVIRVLRGSQTQGFAGMSSLREMPSVRLLRPLLAIDPARLRHLLATNAIDWVEDPSNQDRRATRPRLRQDLAPHTQHRAELLTAMASAGRSRCRQETETAAELAHRATIRPEGFALLSPGRIGTLALASLIQTVSGRIYPTTLAQIHDLASQPRPATVAGVRLLPAGRLGDALLIIREEAAILPPAPAVIGTTWDHRFRLTGPRSIPPQAQIGKLGADAAHFRARSDLPSAILRTLPAIRMGENLLAVPHLGYATCDNDSPLSVLFSPPRAVAGACFVPMAQPYWPPERSMAD